METPICQTGTTTTKKPLPSLKTESQGQISILVTPVTIFCLVQQFSLIWGRQEETGCKMFCSGEVGQDSPWRWEGFISFLCTIPILLYYFRDHINASRAAEVAVCQTGQEARHSSQTVSLNMDFACLLALHKQFAPPRATSRLRCSLCGLSNTGWAQDSPQCRRCLRKGLWRPIDPEIRVLTRSMISGKSQLLGALVSSCRIWRLLG